MNQHKMDVIKEEFGDDLATPLEGWSFVTGDTITRSSLPLSATTTQSMSIRPSPPATTSNHPSTSTSIPSHVKQICPGVASVRLMPPYAHQGLVKNVEINDNNRPDIATRNNKFVPTGLRSHQSITEQFLELQLKQTQELLKAAIDKLDDNRNAYEVLEKENNELQLDNMKLHYELDQLIANAQTHESSQANANIKQEYEDGETAIDDVASDHFKMELKEEFEEETNQHVDCNEPEIKGELDYGQEVEIKQEDEDKEGETILQTSDTSNNQLTETRQVTQIVNTHFESPPNQFAEFMDQQANQLGNDASIIGSNRRNPTKRKQSQSNLTVKRSKRTVEDEDVEEDEEEEVIANEDRVDDKFKVVKLNCPEQNCQVELDSLGHLYDHLRATHDLGPFRCFAQNCTSRFDRRRQIRNHLEQHHPQSTQFLCSICPKEFDSQLKASQHWYYNHLTGQFKCNFVSDCTEVSDTRCRIETHLKAKHISKKFRCTRVGCCASFISMFYLKRHESTHLNSRPFHCNWTNCSHRSNLRENLLRHIRKLHFGLPATVKEQMEKNIVDERDPNDYVRLVEEPIAQ